MAADLRLIVNAAEADPYILLSERAGHGSRNGGLTCSRRSHKAEDRACAFLCEGADRKEFQNAVFYLLQTIVIFLQHFLRMDDVLIVPGRLLPRHLEDRLDIGAQDICLLASARHAFETLDLFFDLLLCLLIRIQLFKLFQIPVSVLRPGIISQLLTDDLQLFPQDVVALVLIDMFLYFSLIITLDHQDLDLTHQIIHDPVVEVAYIVTFQKLLLYSKIPREFVRCLGQERLQVCDHEETSDKVLHRLRVRVSKLLKFFLDDPAHRFLHGIRELLLLHRSVLDLRLQILSVFEQCEKSRSL